MEFGFYRSGRVTKFSTVAVPELLVNNSAAKQTTVRKLFTSGEFLAWT